MYINFTKMHGAGNDFIVIDLIAQTAAISKKQIIRWANRLTGIGFDYMLAVEPPSQPDVDFEYRAYNSQGEEVDVGNVGASCVAQFVYQKRFTSKKNLLIQTKTRTTLLYLQGQNRAQVDVGQPCFCIEETHHALKNQLQNNNLFNQSPINVMAVSIACSHVIIHCNDLSFKHLGSLNTDTQFLASIDESTKVSFIQIIDRHSAKLGVLDSFVNDVIMQEEKACAATAALMQQGLLQSPATIELASNSLNIEWLGQQSPILVSYPAITAYEGKVKL